MSDDRDDFDSGAIDPAALERAQAVIDQLRWTYIHEWAPAAMDVIESSAHSMSRAAQRGEQVSVERREAMLRQTHDMKGQAGTFGLELLQDFAASLHQIVHAHETIGDAEARVIEAHVSAMRSVLSDATRSPNGVLDQMIERELRQSLKKLAKFKLN